MSLNALLDVPAPAKLNLFLHVNGRREDGYHLLQSVFVLIDWCDVLHFERRRDGRLSRTDLGPALPANDLCLQAAGLLQQASGCRDGVHIAIDKQVPWGAGLGGGSSDAASTLLALNRLWGLHWPRERLLPLALQLGADVPFFIGGRNAWVEGIGEQLTPLDLPWAASSRYALLKPPIAVPTAAIFSSPLLSRNTPRAIVSVFLADPFGFGRNDLQPAAAQYAAAHKASRHVAPKLPQEAGCSDSGAGDIDQALALLSQSFGPSRMTGSGSVVFARVGDESDTGAATMKLGHLLATVSQNWSGRLCQGLAQHPLLEWAPGG